MNVKPGSGFADSVMLTPAGRGTGAHEPEQAKVPSEESKLPVWPASPKAFSPTWTIGVTVVALNVTVTVVDEPSTTVHGFPAAHAPAFVQPPNVEDGSGLAVKVTLGGLVESVCGYWPVHIPG
jgi:hypothetical protein